jgi:hypothetical protein
MERNIFVDAEEAREWGCGSDHEEKGREGW